MVSPYVCAVCGSPVRVGRDTSGWRRSSEGHHDHKAVIIARHEYLGAHFHAYYQDHAAVFAIDSIECLGGGLPKAQSRLVEAWRRYTEEAAAEAATVTALLTGEGRILGTAAYMSPQQAEGRPIDSRSDLFSLGIVLFEMVTGQRPFTGDTNMSILSAILKDPPRPISSIRPDVPRELARIVKRALQKDPEQRYQTAKDFRNDLQLLKAESDSGELTPTSAAGAPPRQRSRWAGLGVAAAIVLLLGAPGAAWWLSGRGGRVTPSQWTAVTDYADSATQPALSRDGRMITSVVWPDDNHVAIVTGGLTMVGKPTSFRLRPDTSCLTGLRG